MASICLPDAILQINSNNCQKDIMTSNMEVETRSHPVNRCLKILNSLSLRQPITVEWNLINIILKQNNFKAKIWGNLAAQDMN